MGFCLTCLEILSKILKTSVIKIQGNQPRLAKNKILAGENLHTQVNAMKFQ